MTNQNNSLARSNQRRHQNQPQSGQQSGQQQRQSRPAGPAADHDQASKVRPAEHTGQSGQQAALIRHFEERARFAGPFFLATR